MHAKLCSGIQKFVVLFCQKKAWSVPTGKKNPQEEMGMEDYVFGT